MFDPAKCADNNCEWIEVFNATDSEVDLLGLRIQDSQLNANAQGTVNVSLVAAPGQYVMLGKGPEANWTYMIKADAYTGANPAFNNGNGTMDSAAILNANGILDQTAPYTAAGALSAGVSWKLNGMPSAVANDMAANWCYSPNDFGDGDLGSPKAANDMACNPNLP
ncbi:MAG: lamin tail domain-containing protein [Deltaproteobacteria bacterium]|nr:lamin tail domain-containing protein [Deltaproteobacteria bacterium]